MSRTLRIEQQEAVSLAYRSHEKYLWSAFMSPTVFISLELNFDDVLERSRKNISPREKV